MFVAKTLFLSATTFLCIWYLRKFHQTLLLDFIYFPTLMVGTMEEKSILGLTWEQPSLSLKGQLFRRSWNLQYKTWWSYLNKFWTDNFEAMHLHERNFRWPSMQRWQYPCFCLCKLIIFSFVVSQQMNLPISSMFLFMQTDFIFICDFSANVLGHFLLKRNN